MKKLGLLLFLSVLFIPAQNPEAREWSIVGPRALGMGGANVAVANDATADYWNPAAYGFFKDAAGGDYGKRKWSTAMNAGVGAQIHEDMGSEINTLQKYNFGAIQTAINANTTLSPGQVSDFVQLVNELKVFNDNPNRAATVLADGGLRIQIGHFGIGGFILGDMSASPSLDLVNISPGQTGNFISQFNTATNSFFGVSPCTGGYIQNPAGLISQIQTLSGWNSTQATNYVTTADCALTAAAAVPGATVPSPTVASADLLTTAQLASNAQTGGALANNQSALLFKGIMITEVPLTYGRSITEDFAVGGNLKFMKGKAYNVSVPVFDQKLGDQLKTAQDSPNSYKESQSFGLDLGLLYRVGGSFRIGMVGRNLNGPSFTMPSLTSGGPDESLRELPQVRAGLAYQPFSFLVLAADMDMTRNDTTLAGDYKSQNVGGGLELNIFKFLQLRGGIYKNLAQNDIGPVYTAGLGLNFWLLNLDIGAAMGSKSSQIDSSSVPNEARGEFALSMLF
ncbi:MAG: conjugal transfer protein TraF [Nitrospirae bacterium]|nr:conjugal transfer protein TraF [Nitrospirota bacterium]